MRRCGAASNPASTLSLKKNQTYIQGFPPNAGKIILRKQITGQKNDWSRINVKESPWNLLNEIDKGSDNRECNKVRRVNLSIRRNRRIISIRNFLAIIENRQINSLQRDARCVLQFSAPRKNTKMWHLPEVSPPHCPGFSMNKPVSHYGVPTWTSDGASVQSFPYNQKCPFLEETFDGVEVRGAVKPFLFNLISTPKEHKRQYNTIKLS